MQKKIKNIAVTFAFLITLAFLVTMCVVKYFKPTETSESERRPLAQFPEEITWDSVVDRTSITGFEDYSVDQFPFREFFRMVKAKFHLNILGINENNGLAVKDDYIAKIEQDFTPELLDYSIGRLQHVYETLIKDNGGKHFVSIVPDKNYFLAGEGVLAMDYEKFYSKVYEQTPHLTPVPITDKLQLADYYRTDTHWKQEEIIDVAAGLAESMGVSFANDFTVNTEPTPFYGVYYGQAGLDLPADTISYCTNDALSNCYVYDYENNKEIPLYNVNALTGRDPYEMFLGGNISLATIENPDALSDKELVVFGDSFSRSLLPLLAGSYSKITLVDIRYMWSAQVGNYIEFTNQDVLFLYSTSVLNNSITLK